MIRTAAHFRLTGASPEERLVASLKEELQEVSNWATSGYITQNLTQHITQRRESYRSTSSKIVGIDLGATHSKVAIYNRYSKVNTAIASIPSVVAYTKDGICLVGEQAKRQAAFNPENTFHSVKKLLGRKYYEVVGEASRLPYQITDFYGDIKLDCPILDKQLIPQEIVAKIILKLIEDASNYLAEKVTLAVITVPAYFNDAQRQVTKDTGKLAGIEVLRIIQEPRGASLGYGLDRKSDETILVFDLGGSGLDVSILEVGDGVFEVLATAEEADVGGDELDKKIVDFIANEFQTAEGIDLRKQKQALQRLTEAAEKAKIELLSVTEAEINLPFITATPDGPKHLDTTLTRAKFEELCSDLIYRYRIPVEGALREAKLDKSAINQVVLVGGSTHIPAVPALVRQMLDKEPKHSINPNEAVAVGAAIQARVLSGDETCLLLLDLPDRTNGNFLPRTDFADVAYCGIVRTDESGKAEVSFKLPDAITSYNIEAFAMSQSGTEWCSVKKRLEVSLPVWAEFKLPKFIYPGDKSLATLYVKCASGQFGLRLFCNGVPVEFSLLDAEQIAPNTYQSKQAKVIFEAQPGEWRAEIQDLVTQDYDVCVRTVGELGKFEEVAQRFQLLRAGETFDLRSHQVLELRVLSCLEKPFNLLCDATTNYEHHCCEQTAAKLLAAVASLTATGDAAKLRNVIIAGVAREQKMYLPGKGLALYPPQEWEWGNAPANDYWGRIAAQHLCDLSTIGESLFGLAAVKSDRKLEAALGSAIALGEGAAAAYDLPTIPTQIVSGRDAYRSFMRLASTRNESLLYARSYLKTPETTDRNNVINRSEQAYCAAVLLMAGENSDLRSALNTVNQLARCLNGSGSLYSTVDSVGMIALMSALQAAGINMSGTVYAMQEGEMRALESDQVFSTEKMETIALQEGTALVEMKSIAIEDWSTFAADIPVKIQLSKTDSSLQPGDTVELIAEVESYQPGLLLQVCLPPALSRLEGGGEVKRFSVDFCGQKTLKIPLRVSGYTSPAGEHWRAVVRNMFNDEETGNSGLLCVQVGC